MSQAARPQSRQSALGRQRILRSAAKAFSRLGFRATTMDDIAKEVKATRGFVYYHFRSKAEIFYELHMMTLQHLIEAFHKSVKSARGPERKLEQAIQAHVGFACRNLTLARVTSRMMEVHQGRDFPKRYRDVIIAKRDEYEQLLQAILKEGVAQGVFRRTDASVAVKNILGALNWLVFWYHPRGRLTAPELAQAFSDIFLRGLMAGRATR